MRSTLLCSLVVNVLVLLANAQEPQVEIDDGVLVGKYMFTRKGRQFSGFLAIPYAKPPIGDLRFKPPVKNEPWEEPRLATTDSPICAQRNPYTHSQIIEGEEDCLYLNVYTPQLHNSNSGPLPVMIFFHGGGWVCGGGTSMWYGPDILLEKDVVLVVPNYRLGPFGFLSTHDDVVPGNMGMKDQNMALRWIRDNIAQFGGDPNKVTAFGESAGGASVEYHMLSPLSKGLIHRAISQSGTSLCPWAHEIDDTNKKNTIMLAESFDCPLDSSTTIVDCLRKVSAYDIVAKDRLSHIWDYDPMIPFRPMVEHEHEGAFLTESTTKSIMAGKLPDIPWINGITSGEGTLRVAGLHGPEYEHLLEELKDNFRFLAPISLLYSEESPSPKDVTLQIESFYFGDSSVKNISKQTLIDMYTDAWFMSAAAESTKLHIAHSNAPVYFYYFDHRGVASFSQLFGDPTQDYGVSHADDLQYLFPVSDLLFPDQPPDDHDKQVADILSTIWVNFATTGNPTTEVNEVAPVLWEPVAKSESLQYLHFYNETLIRMEPDFLPQRRAFWASLETRDDKISKNSKRREEF